MAVDAPDPAVGVALAQISADAGHVGDLKSDRIALAFEKQILSGKLSPGTRLPTEPELCTLLGVSRTVVRDSVRTLVARGLLTVRQGRGTTVAEPSGDAFSSALLVLLSRSGLTMGDVVEARAIIDISLVPLAAEHGTDDDWDALDAAYRAFEQAVEAGDAELASVSHAQLHTVILNAIHKPALTMLLRPMSDITIVSGAASVRRESPEDWEVELHEPIVTALRARDGAAAREAMIDHYRLSSHSHPAPYREFLGQRFSDAYFGTS